MANVSFTPDAPESEITWLTTFNLACLTNFMPCRYLEEIYPASEDWHLYDGTLGGRPGSPNQVNSEQPANSMECRIPVFALGREAAKIISVTSLKESQEHHPDEVDEKATVRFNSLLKGSAKYYPGESIDVISRSYNIRNPRACTSAPPSLSFPNLTGANPSCLAKSATGANATSSSLDRKTTRWPPSTIGSVAKVAATR
jgi:hypothetical protein